MKGSIELLYWNRRIERKSVYSGTLVGEGSNVIAGKFLPAFAGAVNGNFPADRNSPRLEAIDRPGQHLRRSGAAQIVRDRLAQPFQYPPQYLAPAGGQGIILSILITLITLAL